MALLFNSFKSVPIHLFLFYDNCCSFRIRIISGKEGLLRGELDATHMFKVICSCIVDKLSFSWSLIKETDKQVCITGDF